MGKEDRFVASISALDGKPKFLLNSFRVGSQTVSNVTGKKLSAASLIIDSEKKKDFDKSFQSAIVSKKAKDRLSGPEADSLEAKKAKRTGAFEVNKEKVADWDPLIQKRRVAKSYDYTNHKSSQPLETINEASQKFKVQTPLEAEISKLLYGKTDAKVDETNPFLRDHSKDLKAVRKHLAEIAKAKAMARQKEAKERYQSKIKSKRYRRALRKSKQEKTSADPVKADLERVEERATLRHKTMSKKLRFYDQHNGQESDVRKSQNAESQRLKAKPIVQADEENDDSDDNTISTENMLERLKNQSKKSMPTISQRINPNDFVQASVNIHDDSDNEAMDSENEEIDFDDGGEGNIADDTETGIEMEHKKNEKKSDFLPGWGSWSSEPPKPKKVKNKTKAGKKKPSLVMKESKVGLANHQLPRLPHPYRNLEDCQADLSQPIGDTFMPKTTVIKTTKPKVHVKLGAMLDAEKKEDDDI